MSPFQFDSDMSDASTTPVVRIPADLSHLGDLAPLQLVRQPAEPRDPWETAIELDYIPFTAALSSDLMDVDL